MLILWVIQVVVVVVAVVVVVVVVVVIDVLVVVVLVDALAPILDTPGCGGTRSSTSSGTMRSRPPKPVHVAFPFMSVGEDVSLMFNCIFFAVNPPKPFSCGLLLLLCWSVCGRRRFFFMYSFFNRDSRMFTLFSSRKASTSGKVVDL